MSATPRREPRLWAADVLVDGRVRVHRGGTEFLMADSHSAGLLRKVLNTYERKVIECENNVAALQADLNRKT